MNMKKDAQLNLKVLDIHNAYNVKKHGSKSGPVLKVIFRPTKRKPTPCRSLKTRRLVVRV